MPIKDRLAALIASKIGDRGKPVNANQVHKATGVPQSTLSRILNGQVTDVRECTLKKLAVYFETTPAALRDESADMPKPVPDRRASADGRSPLLGFEFAALRASQTASELLTTYNNATSEEDRAVIIAVVAALQRQLTAEQSKKKR